MTWQDEVLDNGCPHEFTHHNGDGSITCDACGELISPDTMDIDFDDPNEAAPIPGDDPGDGAY